jgi:hypothetical protein
MKGQGPCTLKILNTLLDVEVITSINLKVVEEKLILATPPLTLVQGMQYIFIF